MLFYFIPMILVWLFLYYLLSCEFEFTNGAVLFTLIGSVLPFFNVVTLIMLIVYWTIESKWMQTKFKKPW